MATIATHNGSAVRRHHNIRNPKTIEKEAHIDPNRPHEIWHDEPPKEAYEKLFGEAVKAYNEKQTREERKIENYYEKIEKDKERKPVYEMIIGVYPKEGEYIAEETQKEIMKKFVETWQERNPNLYMCGAYYHADEQGEPHCHIDYIPVAHGYQRGMETQTGLVKAFGEQGFEKEGRITAQMKWQKRENAFLESLCKEYGIEVSHPQIGAKEHLDTELYKAKKELESMARNTKELCDIQEGLKGEIEGLEAERNKTERQADKALKRKAKAFEKSWKRDKNGEGWTYNQTLKDDIEALLRERADDVEKMSRSNTEVQIQYEAAEQARAAAEALEKQKEQALNEVQETKKLLDSYISIEAEKQAKKKLQEYKDQYDLGSAIRAERLEAFILKYKGGDEFMRRFEEEEQKRAKDLEHLQSRTWLDR